MTRTVITGANRGIGLEMTRQCLARGERVVATARDPAAATALEELGRDHSGQLRVLPLDLADPLSIAACAQAIGKIEPQVDRLINNAGTLLRGERFGEIEAAVLTQSFAVNAAGPMLLTQALAPLLTHGSGKVLNLSSILGSISERDGFYTPSYSISKAALNMATRLLAHALSEQGVVVVCAHPGWVRTDMGGAGAEIDPSESARGLLALLDRVEAADSGGFFSWQGQPLAW